MVPLVGSVGLQTIKDSKGTLLKYGFCKKLLRYRPKNEEKSVQLAEVHLYHIYFLQNPYFK